MANGRPSERGILEIADDSGNVISDVNRLRLGQGITLSRNDNDPSAVIDISISLGSLVTLDAISNLRGMVATPHEGIIYSTAGYYAKNDGGAGFYYWDPASSETDDGFLVFQLSHHSSGRMKFKNVGGSRMFYSACVGPALADLGSRTISFDPTGVTAVGTELKRVTAILRNAGWAGLHFQRGNYLISGAEAIGCSTAPFVPFELNCDPGTILFNSQTGGAPGIAVYAEGESLLIGTGYVDSRKWTQTINGGERVFPGVASVAGLAVGDTVLCRFGGSVTDFGGIWHAYTFAEIAAIDTGTNTVTTWQSAPEQCPHQTPNPNAHRDYNHHDMLKVTGFQDRTSIVGFIMDNVCWSTSMYRDCYIDCTWKRTTSFAINGLGGIGLTGNVKVQKSFGNTIFASNVVTLASQYNTHLYNLVINDMVGQGGAVCNVITNEADCRGTRIDFCDVTYNASGSFGGNCIVFGQTPYSTDAISVGHMVARGGAGSIMYCGPNVHIDVLDNKCGTAQGFQFKPDQVDQLIFRNQLYRTSKTEEYFLVLPTAATSRSVTIPAHGISRRLRIKASTLTGITSIVVTGDNFANTYDITTMVLTGGTWYDIIDAVNCGPGRPNVGGYNSLVIRVTCNGSTPAGNSIAIFHDLFLADLTNSAMAVSETSVTKTIVGSGAPSANATFIGQVYFDSVAKKYYDAIDTGSGSSDWSGRSSVTGALLAANNLSDVGSAATCRTNLGLGSAALAPSSAFDGAGTAESERNLVLSMVESRLERTTVTAAASWTNTPFTAGIYERIVIRFRGTLSGGGVLRMQINGDSAAHYSNAAMLLDGTAATPNISGQCVDGANYAIVGHLDTGGTKMDTKIELDIFKDGNFRVGQVESVSYGSGADTFSVWHGSIKWTDTSADPTTVTIFPSTGTMTGVFELWALPI